jgi:hypothetical protein
MNTIEQDPAHRIKVTITESRELRISLPEDASAGEAEVIVLFGSGPVRQEARTFEQRFPPNPRPTGVVFLEDPTAPVGEDDWLPSGPQPQVGSFVRSA